MAVRESAWTQHFFSRAEPFGCALQATDEAVRSDTMKTRGQVAFLVALPDHVRVILLCKVIMRAYCPTAPRLT